MKPLLACTAAALLVAVAMAQEPATQPAAEPRPVSYLKDVKPILDSACISCHSEHHADDDIRLDSREAMIRRKVAIPGNSAKSKLIQSVSRKGKRMPPSGPRLSDAQVKILRDWVDQGLKWDKE